MILKQPINTEKAVNQMEYNKTFIFEVDLNAKKEQIRKEFEKLYGVKVVKVNTHMRNGKKYAYIKVGKDVNVINLANQMGLQM